MNSGDFEFPPRSPRSTAAHAVLITRSDPRQKLDEAFGDANHLRRVLRACSLNDLRLRQRYPASLSMAIVGPLSPIVRRRRRRRVPILTPDAFATSHRNGGNWLAHWGADPRLGRQAHGVNRGAMHGTPAMPSLRRFHPRFLDCGTRGSAVRKRCSVY